MNIKISVVFIIIIFILAYLYLYIGSKNEKLTTIEPTALPAQLSSNDAKKQRTRDSEDSSTSHIGALVNKTTAQNIPTSKATYETWIEHAARTAGLTLSEPDLGVLQSIFSGLMEARVTYEDKIAKVQLVNQNEVDIIIPEYAAKGLELKRAFEDKINAELGEDKTKLINEKIGEAIERQNFSFGKSPQVITITRVSAGNKASYAVTHSFPGGFFSHTINDGVPSIYNFFSDKFPKDQ